MWKLVLAACWSSVESLRAPAAIAAAHLAARERITQALFIHSVDFVDAAELTESLSGCGVDATARSFEPPSHATDPRCEWVSSLSLREDTGRCVEQLYAWNAPITTVPNLAIRLATTDEAIEVFVDFMPRLDGGYFDAWDADAGAYAQPASREAFAQAATRASYDQTYFTDEAQRWRASVLAAASTCAAEPPADRVMSRLGAGAKGDSRGSMVAGPLFVDVTLPLDEASIALAVETVDKAVERWLGWLEASSASTADASSWMTSRLVYDRDCLVRAQLYTSSAATLERTYGSHAGRLLAQAVAGRTGMVGHNSLGLGRDD